jgi:hypothetical protein
MMTTETVWIYESGDVVKKFKTADEAREWFKKNDSEGVAFKYEVATEGTGTTAG